MYIRNVSGKEYAGESLVDDKKSLSEVQKIANIMETPYIKAIEAYTRIHISVTGFGVDMEGALISSPIAQLGLNNTGAICVNKAFKIMGKNEKKNAGLIIMFPNEIR